VRVVSIAATYLSVPWVARLNQNGSPRAPGQVNGEVRRVLGVAVDLVQVAGSLRVRGARSLGITVEQRTTVVGREQPLVRLDDEAVRELDAVEQATDAGGGERRPAVRAVHVQPHPVLGTCGGHARQVVHQPRVRRAGGGNHGKHVVWPVRQCSGQRFTPVRWPRAFSGTSTISTSSTRAAARTEE
jgi:hypothetical protein